ncbi:hypothetical protein FOL47_007053 [Perkinsus chesapeaki]|uniref:Uncharacterized protein n=1 Tax=Perkinsus chesapeaki TaxID=330153 RepID=A0A7J6LN23_PERCH|nr:hypothetical protein FOL47_007053 [Perkinsus chesapeaki]
MSTTSTAFSDAQHGAPLSPPKTRDFTSIESFLASVPESPVVQKRPTQVAKLIADWEGQKPEPVDSTLPPIPPPFQGRVFAINTPPPPRFPFEPSEDYVPLSTDMGVQTSPITCPSCRIQIASLGGPYLRSTDSSEELLTAGLYSEETGEADSVAGSSSVYDTKIAGHYRDISAASKERASFLIASMLAAAGVSPTDSSSSDEVASMSSDVSIGSYDADEKMSVRGIVLPQPVPRSRRSKPSVVDKTKWIVLPERRVRRRPPPPMLNSDSDAAPWSLSTGLSSAFQRLFDATATVRRGMGAKSGRKRASIRRQTPS